MIKNKDLHSVLKLKYIGNRVHSANSVSYGQYTLGNWKTMTTNCQCHWVLNPVPFLGSAGKRQLRKMALTSRYLEFHTIVLLTFLTWWRLWESGEN